VPNIDPIFLASIILAVGGALVIVSALLSKIGMRLGLPIGLLFLAVGMVAGEDGLGKFDFSDYQAAYFLGTLSLVLILYFGGYSTKFSTVRHVLAPAGTLATVGVLGVALVMMLCAKFLGMGTKEAFLLGAIVSSTDAAAVFASLRGVALREKVAATIEVESGMNDPVAVILTTIAIGIFIDPEFQESGFGLSMLASAGLNIFQQLALGVLFGLGIGYLGAVLLRFIRVPTPGLYPVISVGVALLAYGAPAMINGSGFLSVYLAGLVMGNSRIPHHGSLTRIHDALSWIAQVGMFLMLGLLVTPSELKQVWYPGLMLALFMAFVARPLVVTCILKPFGYKASEIACVAWLGLRGAVPIIIATTPMFLLDTNKQLDADMLKMFNIVFFMVIVGGLMPGATIKWAVKKLGLMEDQPPEPEISIDLNAPRHLDMYYHTVYISPDSPAAGKRVGDILLPATAHAAMIFRGTRVISARPDTLIQGKDHVAVVCMRTVTTEVQQAFAHPGEPPAPKPAPIPDSPI
jgi:potassium/hydrogen antiporter